MAIGPRDLSTLVVHTGWDATELEKLELRDGTTIDAISQQMGVALGALSNELTSGLWGSLIAEVTNDPTVSYRIGVSNGMQRHTEYGRPDEQRAATEGHMLPYQEWDRALGWTYDYLRRARLADVEADIADAIKDMRDKWRVEVLTRLLKRGDDSGEYYGLGTGGYSPGFATAAASTNVDYTPVTYAGNAFGSDHEHYVGISGGAFTAAVFTDAKAELREHGHEPGYNFIVGTAHETEIRALTGFYPVAITNVNYGNDTSLAAMSLMSDNMGVYPIGVIHDFTVYVVPGMPQYYGFGWKSYGQLAQRNPLAIRVDTDQTQLNAMAANDPRNGSPAHPLQYMMGMLNFGVGVKNRENGTARYVNNATWADGTPS